MKGQFFVIATVIMVYTLVLVIQYVYDFSDIRLTQLEEMGELDYIQYIKEALNNTAKSSYEGSGGCDRLDTDINATKKFLEDEMIKKGISLTINYQIQDCPTTNFNFSLRTSNLVTKTETSYLYVPVGPVLKTIILNETNGGNVGDSMVISNDPNSNYGDQAVLGVNYDVDVDDIEYSFLLWNLSKVPAGSIITNAKMCLYLFSAPGTSVTHYAWNTSNNWNEMSITYNNKPSISKLQGTNTTGTTDGVLKCFTVTNAVAHQLTQANRNMSIRISQTVAATYAVPTYAGKEWDWEGEGSQAHRPQLVITYSNLSTCSVLNQAGATYYLDADIIDTTISTCIDIQVNNITLDCQGHLIDGALIPAHCGNPACEDEWSCIDDPCYDAWYPEDYPFRGIYIGRDIVPNTTNVTVKNCRITNFANNFYIWGNGNFVKNITMNNITSEESSAYGAFFSFASNVSIINSSFNNNLYGLENDWGRNFTVINSTFNSNSWGFILGSTQSTTFYFNRVQNNSGYGVYLETSSSNKFYNNILNNSANVYFAGTIYANSWNTTNQIGTRIIGTGNIGGNYWSGYSDTCADGNSDGFCDVPLTLAANNIDYLPLKP